MSLLAIVHQSFPLDRLCLLLPRILFTFLGFLSQREIDYCLSRYSGPEELCARFPVQWPW